MDRNARRLLGILENMILAIEEMATRNCVAESTAQDLRSELKELEEGLTYGL